MDPHAGKLVGIVSKKGILASHLLPKLSAVLTTFPHNHNLAMASSRLLRPARILNSSVTASHRANVRRVVPAFSSARRSYASATKEMTVREALNEAMSEEMEANSKVFVLGEEVYED